MHRQVQNANLFLHMSAEFHECRWYNLPSFSENVNKLPSKGLQSYREPYYQEQWPWCNCWGITINHRIIGKNIEMMTMVPYFPA